MKFYIINAIDPEYNQLGGSLRTLAGAFPSMGKAQAECDSLNSERSDGRDEQYEVEEVEVKSYAAACEQAKTVKEMALVATRAAFLAGCRVLFEAHPDLQSFGWQQYTRGYLKECIYEFFVYSDEPAINGVGGHEMDDETGYDAVTGKWGQVREPGVESELQEPVRDFLETFDDEDMKTLFGEDVSVSVYRDGTIETEDCPCIFYGYDEEDYEDCDEDLDDEEDDDSDEDWDD